MRIWQQLTLAELAIRERGKCCCISRRTWKSSRKKGASGIPDNLADVIRKNFGWADTSTAEKLYPSLKTAQRALDLEGKGYRGWSRLHNSYLRTDCSDHKYGERERSELRRREEESNRD